MSGMHVPYHLRQNKAVERNLFIDLLQRLSFRFSIKDYTYIGFGGPFLEDFKLIHSAFDIKKLISIEGDENTLNRQKFNLPVGCIECKCQKSKDYINSFNSKENKNFIFWLDYTNPGQLGQQVDEFARLSSKLDCGDILKITLNANVRTLGEPDTLIKEDKQKIRFEKFKSRIANNDYFPNAVKDSMMNNESYPNALAAVLETTALHAMKNISTFLMPLSSFVYNDASHQMFTLTAIVLYKEDRVEEKEIIKEMQDWPHFNAEWKNPVQINIPELSARERMAIDKLLHNREADDIHTELGFLFGTDEKESVDALLQYMKYYRHYPLFSKVIY